ncbi:hypothetical protein L7F22_052531 [Adiantum nelumboides]|nr:hypothetical protein [Adiantum nelumboides]
MKSLAEGNLVKSLAPVRVQRAVLSRALGLEGSSNIAAAPAQPAEGGFVPGLRRRLSRSLSRGAPGPSTLGSSHSPINEQRRHSAGSLPSAMGRHRRGPNDNHSPGLDVSVPLSFEALSLNEQQPILESEPPPQPQSQVYLYGMPPTLVTDAMRIRDEVPDWLLGYTNYLVPGLNHVIRNLADAGPYRRSGMLEALSMIIQTYAKYYEEFNSPHVIKPEPCSLDHLLVTTYMPEPDCGI